nr:MAG TPA: minor tail protein [Caudoviricetes sp.]
MDGMQYTPILGEPNLGDSWASSGRALVSMLEDTQLNAKNLGKAAELLGNASDEAIEMAAQAREITKAQKDAITWMNKQIKEQTGLVTKEIVNSTKQMFASIAQKTGGLSPSVVQEATRTLVHPLVEKIVGGLSASEIGKYAMSLVDQGLGLKNLNRYSSGYRTALEGIGKNFQGAIESSKALKEQFDNIRKILSETTLADFSESTGSQKVNRAIADFLKAAGTPSKPLSGKDFSGGARSVTRIAANIAAKSFRTESEAEKQILALFGDNKISEAGKARAKQAAKYAANMQRNSGQNVEIVREKGSNEIKVLVYGADARDKSGRVDRRKAATASFAITGADKRVEDYMIVNGKKMSVSDAKAQYLVDMSSRRVPQNVAATRAKIREINQQTSFKSPSQYEREDNLRGTGADKKLTESRVRFDKEVERLVNIEKELGSTLTNRQLENVYGQLIMLSAGRKQSDPGVKAMLGRFQKDYGLSAKGIKAFSENFSWLSNMGAMSEEDLTNMRLWDLKTMQDKMALVTRKIQGRDIMSYANASKPGQAQNIEIDLSRLFDEKGEVNTAFANQAKDVKAAAEVVKKYRDTLEGLADGIALVSEEQIKNLDVVRKDVSVKLSEEEFKDIAKKLKIDSKSLKKSASLKRIYEALLGKEGRMSTNERVRFSRDEETGAIELVGNELVKAHTGTKINSAYGNLRNVLRAVPPELIEALSVITGVDLMDGKSSRATVISARESQLSSRNIGPMVTRVIANTIDELGTKDIKQEVDKIDTSNLTKGLAEAILGVLTNKLSFDEALEKYAGSNVKARTKMTGEALWLMDQLTGGRKGYRLEDNKLVTDRIATSYMDIIGTRAGEYFPHGTATLPTNWEVEDLLRSARMAGVSVQDPEKLRRLQMMSFGATAEDIDKRNQLLKDYQENIQRNQGLLNSKTGLNANYIAQQDDGNLIVVGQSGLYGNQEHFINIDALRRTRKLDNGQTDALQRAEETIWGKLEAQLANIDKTQARILVDLGADMGEARYLELNKYTGELGDYNDTLEDLLIAVQQGESPEEKKRLLAEVFKSEAYNYENTGGALNAQFLAKMAENQEKAKRTAAKKYGSSLASGVFYGENTNITDIDVSKETNEELKRRIKETGAYIDQEHVRGQVALDLSKYTDEDWQKNTLAYLEFFGKNSKGDWSEVLKNVKTYKDAVNFVTNALTVGTAEHSALYGGSDPLLTRGLSGAIGRQPYSQAINAQFGGMLFGKQGLGLNVLESNRGLNQLIKGDFDGDKLLVALNNLIQTAQVMGESDDYVQKLRNLVAKVEDYNASMYKIVGATSKAVAPNSEAQSTVLDFEGAEVLNEQQLGWVRAFQNQAKSKTGNWSNIAKGVRNVLELQGLGTGAVLNGDRESAVKFTQGSIIFEALEQLEQDAISAKKLWSTAVNAMKNAKGAELDQMTEEEFGATLNEYLENAMIKLIDDVYKGKSSISDVIRISGGQGIFKNDSLDAVRSSRILGTLAKSEGLNAYDAIERALGKDNTDLQLIAKKVGGESATWASLAGDKESFKKILLNKLEKGAFDDFGFSLGSILSIAEEMPDDLLEKGRQEHGRFRRETGPVMSGTAAGDLINSINRLSTNYTKAIEGSNAEIVSILEEIRDLLTKQGRGGLNERYGKTYLTPTSITASLNPYYADESPSGYLQGKILGFKDSKIDWSSLNLEEKAGKFGYTNTKQFEKDRESVVSTFIGTLAHAFSESQVKNNPNLFSEAEEAFKKNLSMLFNEKEVAKYLAIAQEYGRRGYSAYNRLAGPDAYRAAEENVRLKEDDYIVKGKTDAIYTSKRLNEKGEEYQIFNILDFKNKAKIGLDSIEQVMIYVEMYRRIKQELDDMIRSGTGEKTAYEKMSKQTLLSEDTLKALHESLDVSAQIVQNYGGKTKVYDIANAPRDIAYALTHGFSLTKDQEKKLENAATASPQLTQTASAEFQAAYKAATGEAFGVEDYKKISVSYEEKLAEERALKEQLSKAEQGSGKDSVLYQKLAAYYEELRKEIGELDEQRNQLAQELSLGRGVRAGATRYARKEVKHSLEMGELGFGYDKIIKDDEKQRLLAQKQREAALKQYKQYNDQIAKTEKDMLVLDKQINTSPSKLEKGLQADKGQVEILKAELRELVEKRNLLATNNQFTQAETAEMDAQLQKKRELNKLKVASMAKGASNWLDVIGSGVKNTITRMFDYNGVYRVLNRITQGLRQVVQQVMELDTAMFNLQVASGSNREEVSALINDYSKLAKQLHTTTTQIAASANEWLRQGYEAGQANELIKASTYLSKLGMIEAGQATTYLTSMIKGFKLEAADAVNVVDKLTAVDMEAAVSAGGIAAAMQNVATTAQTAGLSLDKTIGYISTIIETTQRDPSSVGMGMRTILARYGNVKAGAFTKMTGMEDSDTDLENINDIEKVLGKVGIRIRENAQEFRNFGDVIDELSLKWQKYDSVTKNAIATAMAGVRQRESFLVLMENKERADELEDVSATSKGTADTKYEAYQQTLSAAKADLQTALQDLAKSIHDSGLILRLTQLGTILTKMIVPGFNMLASALWARNSFKLSTQLQYSLEQRKAAIAASQGLSARKIQEESQRREEWRRAFYEKKEGGTKTFVDKLLGNMPESFTEANKVVQEFTTNLGIAAKNVKNFPNGGGGTPTEAGGSIKETALTVDENSSGSKFRPWDYTPYQKESTYQKGPLKGRTKLKYFINPPGLDKKKLKAAIDSGEITEGQAAKMKLDYKRDLLGDKKAFGQQIKDNVPGAIGAGITSALTTGFTQEGSAGAKATAGITAGALTGIGAAFGPVGAAIGSTLGSILGPFFAKLVDKEETERKERAEDAQKQLDALNSLNNTFEGIHEYTEKEYLTSEAILAIKESVDSIDEQMSAQGLDFDDYLKQAAVKMNLGEDFQTIEGIRELLTAADEKTRQKAQEVFDLAQSMAKVQTTKESKAVTQMSASEYRTYLRSLDKEYIKQAYAISGLEQSSLRELSKMNLEDAIKKVAEQFKRLGVTPSSFALYDSEGNVTEQATKYITDQLRKSDRMQEMLNGSVLTLSEALQDKDKNANVIESFASALGVSTTRLEEMSDQLGALKLSDFVKSASQLREMLNDLYGILDSYYETGYLDLDAQEKILSNYPEYADLISDPGKIAESINQIVDGVKVLYVKNSLNEWAQNEKNAETYVGKFLEGFEGGAYRTLFTDKKYFGDLSTPEQMLQRIDMLIAAGDPNSNVLQAVKDNIEKGMKNYESMAAALAEQLENTKKLESVNKYLDKSYEQQINALEEQKSALEQINSQREYENKLIEAKIKLENAQNEKKKVWREGVGWVYEADTSAIADAQKELEDLDNEKKVNELQAQIDELQAQRDYLGDIANKQELEGLKKVYEDWQKEIGASNVGQAQALEYFEAAYTKIQNLNLNPSKTGSDGKLTEGYLENVTDQRTKNLGAFKGAYNTLSSSNPDTTADYTTESIAAIDTYNTNLKSFKDKHKAYLESGGSNTEAAKELGISEEELQQKLDSSELKLSPKRGAYWGNAYKIIYTTWQPNNTDDAGFLQAKPFETYVLLNDGEWTNVNTLFGITSNSELRDSKYSGLIFEEGKGTKQLFWNYKGQIYKASHREKDWGKESGVDDSTSLLPEVRSVKNKENELLREGFKFATGTLSAPGGVSMVNDDPQYGLEGIITPQGTLTALPSKSGVVPADMTRNVWQLGEVAPNLIKQLVDINGKFNSPLGFGTDESFNVDHLDVHMVAQPGFDMDDFVRKLRAARDLSKHS